MPARGRPAGEDDDLGAVVERDHADVVVLARERAGERGPRERGAARVRLRHGARRVEEEDERAALRVHALDEGAPGAAGAPEDEEDEAKDGRDRARLLA